MQLAPGRRRVEIQIWGHTRRRRGAGRSRTRVRFPPPPPSISERARSARTSQGHPDPQADRGGPAASRAPRARSGMDGSCWSGGWRRWDAGTMRHWRSPALRRATPIRRRIGVALLRRGRRAPVPKWMGAVGQAAGAVGTPERCVTGGRPHFAGPPRSADGSGWPCCVAGAARPFRNGWELLVRRLAPLGRRNDASLAVGRTSQGHPDPQTDRGGPAASRALRARSKMDWVLLVRRLAPLGRRNDASPAVGRTSQGHPDPQTDRGGPAASRAPRARSEMDWVLLVRRLAPLGRRNDASLAVARTSQGHPDPQADRGGPAASRAPRARSEMDGCCWSGGWRRWDAGTMRHWRSPALRRAGSRSSVDRVGAAVSESPGP
ncbi:hypothetical protein Pla163_21430 [Planctomycetes bacterium Pla163]|uniref:Uncharacterized protein n=1 Tax=Rohdeia mirabilis TaxID=2528008 RepID=A0A518D0M2_9BACT|nr:hypothetical protein Pla163_21430 [Planctomycetes bacterium Pla163]